MATYKHLRSSTANKRPTTSIADGQLAINTNTASPGLFFKDSAGTGIVKVGPVHVGTTAPNVSPAAGGSSGNYTGEQWLDTSVSPNQMKVWNGSAWVGIVADELPVSKLQDGTAGQIVQTDSAGTGVEWSSTTNLPIGSAGAPAYSFQSDSNTGIYSPGADQVAITTSGTGRLFVASDGKVGIGTSSPQNLLHLSTSSAADFLRIDGPSTRVYLGHNSTACELYAQSNTGGVAPLVFYTGSAERLRITSDGKVGIGTSSPSSGLHLANPTAGSAANFTLSNPANNWSIRTGTTDNALIFVDNQFTAERARIDSSGRLLVGTSSARTSASHTGSLQLEGTSFSTATLSIISDANDSSGSYIHLGKARGGSIGSTGAVQNGDALGQIHFTGSDGTSLLNGALIGGYIDGAPGTNDLPTRLVFSTTADGASSPTERMRIDSLGRTQLFSAGGNHVLRVASDQAAGTTVILIRGFYSATDNSTSGTESFRVFTNGDVVNSNNSYGALSDIKLKENIVDASSQWNDLKALQVRKYNLKEGQTHTQIGLVAQEVELVSPGLVNESPDRDEDGNDLGTVTKSVNYSVLYMKAVKALQEAMERIETLEAKVAALESA